MGDWTFFSNYGHVLVCLARDNRARLRDVAAKVGITERAVQNIVRDLETAGYLEVSKQGRCNRYRLNRRKSLRHALEAHCNVGKLLTLLVREEKAAAAATVARVAAAPVNAPEPPAEPAVADEGKAADTQEERKPSRKEPRKKAPKVDPGQQGDLF